MAHFVYFMLYLGAFTFPLVLADHRFIQFLTSDLTKLDCTALSGTGSLYTSFCALPKACTGLDGVCWFVTSILK